MMKAVIIACISIISIACLSLVESEQPLKVLVITGTHEYNRPAFNAMFNVFKGMDCSIKEMGASPGELFEEAENFPYDAIVMYNFKQEISPAQQEKFKEILRSGVGLTVIHHGLAGFPGWTEYEDIIGATYVLEEEWRGDIHYPRPTWKHGVDMQIHVEDAEHQVCKGISNFLIHDETYKGWVYHKGNHLLLSTEHESSNHQISWTRTWGGTRVFCIQLGHDEHAFGNENFRKLLRQGIMWSTVKEVGDEGLIDVWDAGMVRKRGPILIAHRGGVTGPDIPECSGLAVKTAASFRYDMVELDVRSSRDQHPVVFHDGNMMKACGINKKISDFTLDELKEIKFLDSDETITSLDSMLSLCRSLNLGVMFDIKQGERSDLFFSRIRNLIDLYGLERACMTLGDSQVQKQLEGKVLLTIPDQMLAELKAGSSVDLDGYYWFGVPEKWDLDLVKTVQDQGGLVIPALNTFRYSEDEHRSEARYDAERLLKAGVDGFQIDCVYQDYFGRERVSH